jgi:2-dehydro-3-deoxyphosphogluconate aldolase/(4S)-4-hydroxy-2-oxoglutarate aldolase
VNVERFKRQPIMGILRGGHPDDMEPLVEAVCAAGLQTLEIAMNTPNAEALLRRAVAAADGRLTFGAGTVLTVDTLHRALQAGATFAVLPTLEADVVEECGKRGIPVFPGAFTPQEIHNAWRAGATMVKVFPARSLGPAYFEEIRGPFDNIPLLACGGVNAGNVAAFFGSGAAAVAFGGSVFRKEWMNANDFRCIEAAVRELVRSVEKVVRIS